MKYVSTPEFEFVTGALNFDTADCRIEGGCDLYTTRAAGADKKLYKNIEHTLESQHESILRLSASLSPPQADALAPSLNLSRSSPFGPLSQISSRRTFAYLIATLNASHPDYDFSYTLRPTDFRKERSLRGVMNTIDSTLFNLRPRTSGALLAVPMSATGVQMPGGTSTWGPRMWQLIDKEISLRDCAVYCYSPEEDPMDGEDGAIWSLNYFFFNKAIKRVCYIYLRALSIISHSPASTSKRKKSSRNSLSIGSSAGKRAKYWLGDMAEGVDTSGDWGEEDDDDMVIEEPGDDEVDRDDDLETPPAEDSDVVNSEDDMDDDEITLQRNKSSVRAMSEHMMDAMEV